MGNVSPAGGGGAKRRGWTSVSCEWRDIIAVDGFSF